MTGILGRSGHARDTGREQDVQRALIERDRHGWRGALNHDHILQKNFHHTSARDAVTLNSQARTFWTTACLLAISGSRSGTRACHRLETRRKWLNQEDAERIDRRCRGLPPRFGAGAKHTP